MKKRALRKIFLSLLVVIVSIVAVYLIVTGLNENFEKKDVGMSPETNVLAQSNYNQYQIRDISDANGNIYSSTSSDGSQLPKYSGYIIEFTDVPLVVKKSK